MQAPHLDLIDKAYLDISAGRTDRVLIAMPPRHGKSRRAARWGPLWYLLHHPEHRVIIGSYAADLAADHGRWQRDTMQSYPDLGMRLRLGSAAADRLDLAGSEGGIITAGVGGVLTGRGAHLMVIDDPVKDQQEADSATYRRRTWAWWQSTVVTRMEPRAAIILIQTRWHEDDLAGRILEREADEWQVLNLPALSEADDVLDRVAGQALWPQRYDEAALGKIRHRVGTRVWGSLYQQHPRPTEGGVWQWSWITDHGVTPVQVPKLARVVVAVDPSGGDGQCHDETGIVGAGVDYDAHAYLLADRTGRMSADAWGKTVCELAIDLGADAIVYEANFGGDTVAAVIRNAWRDLPAERTRGLLMPALKPVHAGEGKRLRAEPVAQVYEQGRVHHVGDYPVLEAQMTSWVSGMDSPNNLDAAVHALNDLLVNHAAAPSRSKTYDERLHGRR